MPCGSRSRRNRRNNRHRKKGHQNHRSTTTDSNTNSIHKKNKQTGTIISKSNSSSSSGSGNDDNDDAKKKTNSNYNGELHRNSIEKKFFNVTRVSELTTVRCPVPLEAKIDHIPGVGIVESSTNNFKDPSVSEPIEPVQPLPKNLTARVENLTSWHDDVTTQILPKSKRFDFLEIREITDDDDDQSDDIEKTNKAIVIEAESDVEDDKTITLELERQLRCFIEALKLPSSPTVDEKLTDASLQSTDVDNNEIVINNNSGRDEQIIGDSDVFSCQLIKMNQEPNNNNRCLDVIEEDEGETSEQNIRDFINEEIGKYRRDNIKSTRVFNEISSTKDDDSESYTKCENVETFMNLVKSLKERVINDFEDNEKTEKKVEITLESAIYSNAIEDEKVTVATENINEKEQMKESKNDFKVVPMQCRDINEKNDSLLEIIDTESIKLLDLVSDENDPKVNDDTCFITEICKEQKKNDKEPSDEIFDESVPPPPTRSTSLNQLQRFSSVPIVEQRIIVIPSFMPCLSSNNQNIDEQIETMDLVRSLLVLLSSQENSKQNVLHLLAQHDLEKLPTGIRHVVRELTSPNSRCHNLLDDVIIEEEEPSDPDLDDESSTDISNDFFLFNDHHDSSGEKDCNENIETIGNHVKLGSDPNVDEKKVNLVADAFTLLSSGAKFNNNNNSSSPSSLKDLCAKKLKSMRLSNNDQTSSYTKVWQSNAVDEVTCSGLYNEHWTGVPTKDDPNVLVCFSPAQQSSVVKTSVDNLLDLHKKFINRQSYRHDRHRLTSSPPKYIVEIVKKPHDDDDDDISITSAGDLSVSIQRDSMNSLVSENDHNYDIDNDNIKATEIYGRRSDWYVNPALIIDDDKPKETDKVKKRITTVDPNCIDTRSLFDQTTKNGNTSLAGSTSQRIGAIESLKQSDRKKKLLSFSREYFDQQLKYIQHLQNQLKGSTFLGEELKKKKSNVDGNALNYSPEESKLKKFLRELNEDVPSSFVKKNDYEKQEVKRDFKRVQERPVSNALIKGGIPIFGETFRQQMYDEYVNKVLEREKRKQHRVIKISSQVDLPDDLMKIDDDGNKIDVRFDSKKIKNKVCMNKVEQEFIEKARNRLSKHGIELDESETEAGCTSSENELLSTTEAKIIVDGKEIKNASRLPKHLKEFLELTVQQNRDEDDGEMMLRAFLCVCVFF